MATLKNTRLYTDIDLDMTPHPLTGNLVLKTNEDAVKRSIRNIVMYNKYEKPFDMFFGSSVREMLFENIQPSTAIGIESRIKAAIEQHEPRANVIEVVAEPDELNSEYQVTITFTVINVLNPIITTVYLQRIR